MRWAHLPSPSPRAFSVNRVSESYLHPECQNHVNSRRAAIGAGTALSPTEPTPTAESTDSRPLLPQSKRYQSVT